MNHSRNNYAHPAEGRLPSCRYTRWPRHHTASQIDGEIAVEKGKADGKDLQALIAADEKVNHGLVVRLIDAVRKNGITDFAINVELVE